MAVSPLIHAIVPEVEETPKPWSRSTTSPVRIPVSIDVPLPQIVAQDAEGNHKERGHHIADHQPLTVSRATRPCHHCGSVSARPRPERTLPARSSSTERRARRSADLARRRACCSGQAESGRAPGGVQIGGCRGARYCRPGGRSPLRHLSQRHTSPTSDMVAIRRAISRPPTMTTAIASTASTTSTSLRVPRGARSAVRCRRRRQLQGCRALPYTFTGRTRTAA
jgi:hypothetical protein